MKRIKTAYILNLCIVALEIFAVGWMFSGLRLPGTGSTLSASRIAMFKFFTVDSNVIMGIVSAKVAIDLKKIMRGKMETLPKLDYLLTLMGATGVTLTMLVTVFYLAPTIPNGWFVCFNNSNLFLHVINPIVSIVTFLFFERTDKMNFKDAVLGVVPMSIYAVFYITMAIINSKDGYVLPGYDFYGFFAFGLKSGFIVFPIIFLLTYGISAGLYKLNHTKKQED